MAISQLLLRVASSNLVGRTSKWYFIIKFSLLLSIVLCWREIRPDAGKTTENEFVASLGGGEGEGNFLMSGIWVCATDQGRFFTSKNTGQAPNFELLLQNRPYLLTFYSRTGSFFDNLVSNARLKCQNPSCFQLLFPAAWCLHFCSIILEQVFQAVYNWDQFESGHTYSSLNLTWIYHCG